MITTLFLFFGLSFVSIYLYTVFMPVRIKDFIAMSVIMSWLLFTYLISSEYILFQGTNQHFLRTVDIPGMNILNYSPSKSDIDNKDILTPYTTNVDSWVEKNEPLRIVRYYLIESSFEEIIKVLGAIMLFLFIQGIPGKPVMRFLYCYGISIFTLFLIENLWYLFSDYTNVAYSMNEILSSMFIRTIDCIHFTPFILITWYIMEKDTLDGENYLEIFVLFILSIFLHAMFDICLTYGITWVILLNIILIPYFFYMNKELSDKMELQNTVFLGNRIYMALFISVLGIIIA